MARFVRFMAVVLVGMLAGAFALVGPASAHGQVTVEPARAGAQGAKVTVAVDAESKSAGPASVRVVLPAGIVPADVTYLSGPAGWTYTAQADGYTVSGPALGVGREARHQVQVRELPKVPTLAFKIVQTYGDGQADRWIEVPSAANPNPENPAPVVTLAPPPGGFPPAAATPVSSAPASPSASADPPTAPPAAAEPGPRTSGSGDGGSALPWVIVAVALVAAATVGGVLVARRRHRPAAADPDPDPDSDSDATPAPADPSRS